ncbi:MAG TPA: restriction endonuclease [Syntrophus sp. (in: bacteria)]|nr:restriction endonuclease [Syntrophus sp. (in: bacteria)]
MVQDRINEALTILDDLGFPRQQQNERSALTLLSLLGLKPTDRWANATDPLMGITPMMEFFQEYYGKKYAPNTRETVRRQTVHQFMQAALIVANPDKPSRPTNSPKAVYQIEPSALKLLRSFGKPGWMENLQKYLRTVDTLKKLYARERDMKRLPIRLANGQQIRLSPGGQNILVKKIMDDFCPLFTPGCDVIYVGDTQMKWAYFDFNGMERLGVKIQEHGKMPDVVVHHTEKDWIVLIEAVTSHGPVNPKRRWELKELFSGAIVGLVFVTAFLDRKAMLKYLNDISWETEVWIAESPTHLIHFNGERFLGPYET